MDRNPSTPSASSGDDGQAGLALLVSLKYDSQNKQMEEGRPPSMSVLGLAKVIHAWPPMLYKEKCTMLFFHS